MGEWLASWRFLLSRRWILFFLAVSAMEIVGLFMGGWGSNNKYALLGAMRFGLECDPRRRVVVERALDARIRGS